MSVPTARTQPSRQAVRPKWAEGGATDLGICSSDSPSKPSLETPRASLKKKTASGVSGWGKFACACEVAARAGAATGVPEVRGLSDDLIKASGWGTAGRIFHCFFAAEGSGLLFFRQPRSCSCTSCFEDFVSSHGWALGDGWISSALRRYSWRAAKLAWAFGGRTGFGGPAPLGAAGSLHLVPWPLPPTKYEYGSNSGSGYPATR